MTNKEILKADLLDIIFENRNKDYGAYALRKGYNHRLLTAIGAALSVFFLFVLINVMGKKEFSSAPVTRNDRIVEIKEINLAKEKLKEPEKPKEPQKTKIIKPAQKIATQKFTSQIKITPDKDVKKALPEVAKLDENKISDETTKGKKDDLIPKEPEKPVITGNGDGTTVIETEKEFKPQEKAPEFPGGPDALKKFLAGNLQTPGELEDGEKKVVRIRFKVDKDGSVNTFEIVTSGGSEYDREVVRVCKKMPRWTPAIQNGINVPVSYVLPVTFIGVEQ